MYLSLPSLFKDKVQETFDSALEKIETEKRLSFHIFIGKLSVIPLLPVDHLRLVCCTTHGQIVSAEAVEKHFNFNCVVHWT